MNILFISTLYPAYEGHSVQEITYALHNFVKEWNKSNNVIVFRPYFIPSKKKTSFPSEFNIDNVTIYNVPVYKIPKSDIYFTKNIIKKIKSIGFIPEKVICHHSSSFLWGYQIALKYKSDFIVGIHNSDLRKVSKKYLKPFTYSKKIACRSKSIQDRFIRMYPQFREKTFIANSGINSDEIESRDFFEKKIESWKDKVVINFTTVSLLQKGKNIDINIRAFYELKYNNWSYTIIGDGEEREYLKKLVSELKLSGKINFLGMKERNEVLEYLKKSDVFIMISAPETFGLAYLEAMAKANIVIGAKGWGIDGVIEDHKNGFLVEPRNVEATVSVLNNLFRNGSHEAKDILTNTYYTINDYTNEKMAKIYLDNII